MNKLFAQTYACLMTPQPDAKAACALIHSLAHIEFNAINLALDAVYRFRDLPPDFYGDQHDETGHVAIGNRWYGHLCAQRGIDPMTTFFDLLREYDAPALRPPFNMEARAQAGFSAGELEMLKTLAAGPRT